MKVSNMKPQMFEDFFSPFVEEIKNNIIKKLNNDNKLAIHCEDITKFSRLFSGIYDNLFKLCIRTLIRELHIYSEQGELSGATSQERYLDFEEKIAKKRNKKILFEKYPILMQKIEKYIETVSEYVLFILDSYAQDKSKIERYFDVQLLQILDISIGSGDTHNGGKSVAIIHFKNINLVFKPHNLISDDILDKILSWINNNANLKCFLNKAKTFTEESRGWQEFIEYIPCEDTIQANRFYYRMGCFLAIFYSLGTTDLHYENVIACSENPMFIDLETLLTNRRLGKMQTVLETGLLPQPTNQIFDVDISGICGKSSKSLTLKTLVLKNKMTDEMHVIEESVEIKNQQNIVMIDDKRINIQDYESLIVNGFHDTINFMIQNKSEYLDLLNSIILDKDEFRIVLRHTTVYAKYNAASLHPDYLTCLRAQEDLFKHLEKNCTDEMELLRVKNEIEILMKDDIPYYMFRFKSLDLYSDKGVVCKNYFLKSAYENISDRISYIEKNKMANIGLIRKSLFTAYDKEEMGEGLDLIYNRTKNNNEVIQSLVDKIIDNVFYQDEEVVMYYINSLYNNRVYLKPINADLYEGGGIIILLAAFGVIKKCDKYVEIAKKLLVTSTELLEYKIKKQQTEFEISAFSGYGSLLYINYFLYFLTNDFSFKEKANIFAAKITKAIDEDKNLLLNYDFLNGLAGCIVFLSYIWLKDQNNLIEKLLKKLGILFVEKACTNEENRIGFAHGLSGYAYAYCMLYMVMKEEKFYIKAKELLYREDEIYNNGNAEPSKVTWCKGETGMCISRLKFLELCTDNNISKSLSKYYEKIVSNGLFKVNNMCLCHGIFGNIEIVRRINEQNNLPIITKISNYELNNIEKKIFEELNDMKFGYNSNFYPDIFMCGFTGVAYELLREENKHLPSILFLEV